MPFRTVKEIISWKSFKLKDTVYDLSHLDAGWIEYLDDRDEQNPITYKFLVTYGLHCFTKGLDTVSTEESALLMYHSARESREFNLERYSLSKQLPEIIQSLGKKSTLVCHAGYGNYAIVKVLNGAGIEVNYFVVFSVFRESKKLRLHVTSAYPKESGIGKIKKVSFFVIAKSLLQNKKLPQPHK
jgi:hypothetical protein